MPLGDITSKSSGELKNIMVEQVDSMETTLAHLVPEFTANLVGPMLLFIYMFILDWRLALLSLVPFVVGMSVMMGAMNEHYKEMYAKSVKIGQMMNNSIVEYINGIEVIKTFNQNDNSYKKYSDSVYNNAQFFYNWMGESMTKVAIGRLLSPMGILTVIPFGILFYTQGSVSLPSLITLIVLSFATVSSIVKVMNYMDDLSRISTITGEIGKILNSRELENKEKHEEVKNYNIELQHVDFSYDEKKESH
ncbi:TPA: ABC transporter transmembrane domain-containing protein [Enterococcus faecalis]